MSRLSGATRASGRPGALASFETRVTRLLLLGLAVLALFALLPRLVPSFDLFRTERVDRTGPSVLQSITELHEYHAASAHYETVVDLEDQGKGPSWLPEDITVPGWLAGERVIYVAKGDADAVVDFSTLGKDAVTVDEQAKKVTVTLPEPRIDKPVLDIESSYVADHDKGITNQFRGSQIEKAAQLRAMEQMTTAATGEGRLMGLAKQNTTQMLRGLLTGLGYTDVTVTFTEPSR